MIRTREAASRFTLATRQAARGRILILLVFIPR
jgi:hypothetical protein